MDVGANEDDTVLVISIINLAHNLGLKVVAEGVENQLIKDQLTAFDCDAAQGYFWSNPLPPADLARWLGESPYGFAKDTRTG
jgi:EAL domain-containing protein (putative c-di-GMP-specific phosphodiesterase class I)